MKENIIRFLLIGYHLVFLLSAIAFGIVGGYTLYIYENFYHLLSSIFYIIGILALLSCTLTAVVFFIGCIGTLTRNSCIIITFSVFLCFVLLSELCVGIAGFLFKNEMHSLHGKYFMESLQMYRAQVGMSERWDNVQTKWDCCGTNYYKDWKIVFENDNLPISCCRTEGSAGNTTCTQFSRDLRREGCLNYFGLHLEDIITITASLGIVFAVFQCIGVGLSCYAAKLFRKFNIYR